MHTKYSQSELASVAVYIRVCVIYLIMANFLCTNPVELSGTLMYMTVAAIPQAVH